MRTSEVTLISNRAEAKRRLTFGLQYSMFGVVSYISATSTILGFPVHPLFIFIGIINIFISSFIQYKRPKLLILRRFGNPMIERLLLELAGGQGIFQTIWLYDDRCQERALYYKHSPFFRHTPDVWVVLFRIAFILTFAYSIIGTQAGNLHNEYLWTFWLAAITCSYDYDQIEGSRKAFTACLITGLTWYIVKTKIDAHSLLNTHDTWTYVFTLATLFTALWLAFYFFIKHSSSPIKKIFNAKESRSIRTINDIIKFTEEIRKYHFFRKYIPTAHINVIEIPCNKDIWRKFIITTLNDYSLILADVSLLTSESSLAWELTQAQKTEIPVLYICEEQIYDQIKATIKELNLDCDYLVKWKYDPSKSKGFTINTSDFTDKFSSIIEKHKHKRKDNI